MAFATKNKPKVHPGKYINTKGHWMLSMEPVWAVMSSNKKDRYKVKMVDSGFVCSCPAFVRCKHISYVEQQISGPVQ